MAAPTLELKILQGKTLTLALKFAGEDLVYKPVSAIVSLAPARLTVTGHNLPAEWPVRVESAKAPLEINTAPGQWKLATKVDANTLEFNDMNLTAATAFVGPAVLIYQRPEPMTGWKIRAQFRAEPGGPVLLDASSDVADSPDGTITIDHTNCSFELTFTDEITAAITWLKCVYDIEAILPDGSVTQIIAPSKAVVEKEITVWA